MGSHEKKKQQDIIKPPMKGQDEFVLIEELIADDRYFEDFSSKQTVALKEDYRKAMKEGKKYTFPPVWEKREDDRPIINMRIPQVQPAAHELELQEQIQRQKDLLDRVENVNVIEKGLRIRRIIKAVPKIAHLKTTVVKKSRKTKRNTKYKPGMKVASIIRRYPLTTLNTHTIMYQDNIHRLAVSEPLLEWIEGNDLGFGFVVGGTLALAFSIIGLIIYILCLFRSFRRIEDDVDDEGERNIYALWNHVPHH